MILIIISSIWAGATGTNYASLAAARAVQGIGAAPFESLLNAAVGDLYPVHQRGVRMACTNLAVFGGAFFTPILVGVITHSLGWQWTFYFVAIFTAATWPAVFFFCPETAYRREERLNTDTVGESDKQGVSVALRSTQQPSSSLHALVPEQQAARPDGFALFPKSNAMQPLGTSSTPLKSFAQSVSLFDGRKTDDRYWVLLLRPFPILANPAFLWGCLIQGTMIGWTVFIGVIVAALFIGPPYLWGEVEAGYAYTGPFIGAVGGFVVSGLLADTTAKWMTKKNGGVYEPEFRILLIIPMLIIGGIGLYGFALTAGQVLSRKFTYVAPLVFFGFEVAGMVIGAVASSLYIVDAYRESILRPSVHIHGMVDLTFFLLGDLTIEGFTIMIIFKNIFSFGLTYSAYEWIIQDTFENVMIPIASIQVGICLLSVPLCKLSCQSMPNQIIVFSRSLSLIFPTPDIFGKRIRAFYHRHDLLKLTGLN